MTRVSSRAVGAKTVLCFALLLSVLSLSADGVSSAVAQPRPTTLDSLLRDFSRLPGMEARFREEKRIALLAVPVRSEGRIYFAPGPARLMRRVTSPDPSAALIANDQLRMRNGDQTEELSIRGNPVLHGFVESFRAVLAGDQATLERFYRARLTPGDADAWELTLTPRNEALAGFVREIRMQGHGVVIEQMRMIEVSGDETLTTFDQVNTQRRYRADESARIFRID